MVATNMYANILGILVRTIILSIFVMLKQMDYFKPMLTLCITQNVHHQNQMSRKRLQTRGILTTQEDVR